MTLLLDANVLFPLLYEPEKLPRHIVALLQGEESRVLMSHATVWETLAKVRRGSMLLSGFSTGSEMEAINASGAELLPILEEDVLTTVSLPDIHRDPFDRMLIAQALRLRATIVSSDRELRLYGVPVIPL